MLNHKTLLLSFLASLPMGIEAVDFGLETDDATYRLDRLRKAFYKADSARDQKITKVDQKGWKTFKGADANGNGEITREEFYEHAELPYPQWDAEVTRNIVYKEATGEKCFMDIYQPLVKKYKKAPVFYHNHGGGWSGGDKELNYFKRPMFEKLSREGFICVSVSYRLVKDWDPNSTVKMRDCVVDCRDGLRFLKKHEDLLGVDMDKVVIFGDSAGGHLTQMLTFSSPDAFIGDADLASYHAQPAAGVSWYGPSDFTNQKLDESTYVDMKFKPGFWAAKINKSKQPLHYNSQSKVVKKMMEEVSPVTWLTKDSRPLLQIHGKQDSVISYAQGVHLKEKADKVGAPVTFLSVNHAGHGWHTKDMEPSFDAVTQKGVDFVLDHTVRK